MITSCYFGRADWRCITHMNKCHLVNTICMMNDCSFSLEFDWYLKADDDSYFIVDRLRSYLSQLDPKKPYFIGFRLKRRFVSFSGVT